MLGHSLNVRPTNNKCLFLKNKCTILCSSAPILQNPCCAFVFYCSYSSYVTLFLLSTILKDCDVSNSFNISVEELACKYKISTRTLQRYFESITSLSTKKALQIMRIRKATLNLTTSPVSFDYKQYGYYDNSHFYKHIKQFLKKSTLEYLKPHIKLLNIKSDLKKQNKKTK